MDRSRPSNPVTWTGEDEKLMCYCYFKEEEFAMEDEHIVCDKCPFAHGCFCGYGMDKQSVERYKKIMGNVNKEVNKVFG